MNVHSTALHLDGNEPVLVDHGPNHDALTIGGPLDRISLVLSHDLTPAARIQLLDEIAAHAAFLSSLIADRVAVSA